MDWFPFDYRGESILALGSVDGKVHEHRRSYPLMHTQLFLVKDSERTNFTQLEWKSGNRRRCNSIAWNPVEWGQIAIACDKSAKREFGVVIQDLRKETDMRSFKESVTEGWMTDENLKTKGAIPPSTSYNSIRSSHSMFPEDDGNVEAAATTVGSDGQKSGNQSIATPTSTHSTHFAYDSLQYTSMASGQDDFNPQYAYMESVSSITWIPEWPRSIAYVRNLQK